MERGSLLFEFLGDNHTTVWLPHFYIVEVNKNPTIVIHNNNILSS